MFWIALIYIIGVVVLFKINLIERNEYEKTHKMTHEEKSYSDSMMIVSSIYSWIGVILFLCFKISKRLRDKYI